MKVHEGGPSDFERRRDVLLERNAILLELVRGITQDHSVARRIVIAELLKLDRELQEMRTVVELEFFERAYDLYESFVKQDLE